MKSMRKAFTAIEILIVVTVILILVGMLVPTISRIRRQARDRLARTKLQGLKVAIELYRSKLGAYPPDTGHHAFVEDPVYVNNDGSPDDQFSLYRYLCGPGGQGIFFGGIVHGPFLRDLEDSEIRVVGAENSDQKILLDPWGNPWVYEENWSITRRRNPAQALLLRMHHAHYDIFSAGMNGEMEDALHDLVDNDGDGKFDERDEEAGADDITSWSD